MTRAAADTMADGDPPFAEPAVATAFAEFPDDVRGELLALRRLIFATAARTGGVGPLGETLKWGQPAYLTSLTKSGSTIRIDRRKDGSGGIALYCHCATDLIATYRELYGDRLAFEGKRAILLPAGKPLPVAELGHCIALALTYHTRKRTR
ncbi:DUF1801 domain-containing protein [Oceanibacterium hippocampi]|uniref:YdhG-like domain-containing protein n=1 Tax=Oceanibacterium hippocampi TaxID=745714 RepID=A0A1Y5SRN3_9PROT|nr:DUF1801 domain-containing protein [Oceanibacterium hippocampi]SLN43634.1 hypothetical protein OCH7691_01822 [Oceanibacterium hippocampi]